MDGAGRITGSASSRGTTTVTLTATAADGTLAARSFVWTVT
jgi:hypothetical protein